MCGLESLEFQGVPASNSVCSQHCFPIDFTEFSEQYAKGWDAKQETCERHHLKYVGPPPSSRQPICDSRVSAEWESWEKSIQGTPDCQLPRDGGKEGWLRETLPWATASGFVVSGLRSGFLWFNPWRRSWREIRHHNRSMLFVLQGTSSSQLDSLNWKTVDPWTGTSTNTQKL